MAPVTAQGWRQREPGALYAYGMAPLEPAQIRLVPYYAWGQPGPDPNAGLAAHRLTGEIVLRGPPLGLSCRWGRV